MDVAKKELEKLRNCPGYVALSVMPMSLRKPFFSFTSIHPIEAKAILTTRE